MDPELLEVVQRSRGNVDPRWDDAQVERALHGAHRLRRRRQRVRGVAAVALLALAAAGVSRLRPEAPAAPLAQAPRPAEVPARPSAPEPPPMRFDDGTTAQVLDGQSELQVRQVSASLIALQLTRGRARFAVQHQSSRLFRVECGSVVAEVLGTRFTVSRGEREVAVAVEEGRVLVRWGDEVKVLDAQTQASLTVPDDGESAPEPSSPESHPEAERRPPVRRREPVWKQEARRGQYDRAYRALGSAPAPDRPRGLDELLLASDAARLSGHPEAAVPYLAGVMKKHPSDPRAALAAFTLGRVYLYETHQPSLAAEAFERARRLNPAGSLAEDALAREVEAWSRANAPDRARARAGEYLRRYPEGHRASSVRVFGGIE